MEKQGENISGKHNIFNPKMLKRLGKRVTNNGRLVNNVNTKANAKAKANKSATNTSRPSSPENPSNNALGNPSPVAATPTGGRRSRSRSRSRKSRSSRTANKSRKQLKY